MSEYYVQIVDLETNEIVKQMGPMTEQKADKVCSGVLINLNHERFDVEIVEEGKND